ncbi:MAG: NAD-dependent epimerase/dehydratase family protein [Bacteroidales bacterium]|jgi:UDP-glucose 4-epimerase|nr:NAD-dependent epimerase/dehydratase family protein [Bacteroidales bacterium]MCK9499901.1 NAD-dependent epimerase/dehydratase family protein [Bacteroidales bacterium]MDY0314354.1 NAD-dependent epimerase/dehydratase family protein [Bacteroidales bacterium]NLB86345.1 NAD-dependent epimerase/dehydratase family protein [Bacteroidales bacterium]
MKTLTPIHNFKRKILVTGGAGFIASSLAEKLSQDKENLVIVLDNLLTGDINKITFLSDNLRFIKADVNKYEEIMEVMLSYQFHYVFHYAAMVGVLRTQKNPVGVLNDIKGIENICRLSKNTGVRRVFYASSSEVYGEPVEFPQNVHTTPLNSRLPYAIVKNLGEAFLRSFNKEFGLDFTIFRFFNTYGAKQSKDFVISKFIYAALKNNDITIYGDGSQTRTFCYIDDNIEACTKIAYNDLFINDVVNIGNSIETPIIELAQKIIKISESKSKIIHLPPLAEGDMTRRCPDNSSMLEVLNRELISLEQGIDKILKTGLFEIINS